MKCIVDGCPGTAAGGNYCLLHRRKTVSPRPGISGIFGVRARYETLEIQKINEREESGVKFGRKIKKKIKGVNIIIFSKTKGNSYKKKILNSNMEKFYPGIGKIKILPRGKKFEKN